MSITIEAMALADPSIAEASSDVRHGSSRDSASADRLRVGIYTPSYPGVTGDGGIGAYTRSLALGLTRLGHEVHVLTPGITRKLLHENVTLHPARADYLPVADRVLPGAGACLHLSGAMRRLVRSERLQVVEFPNWGGYSLAYAMRRRVPLVVRLHTSSREAHRIDGGTLTRPQRYDVRRERWSARMADALVTHSEAHRLAMAEELGVDPRRIDVIPHGIDAPRPPSVERDNNAIVFLGRLETRKGPLDLLHAAEAVLAVIPSAQFYLIGEDRAHCPGGRTHAEYVRQELPAAVQARVRFLGRLPQDQVDQWLQRAAVFVAPSVYESFGLVLLEAMRWATPVVSTSVGGIPEVIEDGATGILVRPGRPEELAGALVKMLSDAKLRARIGQNGRDRCLEQFSTEKMATRVADSYRRAIEQWSRR